METLKEVLLRTNKKVMLFQRGILTIKVHAAEFNVRTKVMESMKDGSVGLQQLFRSFFKRKKKRKE